MSTRSTTMTSGRGDGEKLLRIEARPTDQISVDSAVRTEVGNVVWSDASAVQNRRGLRESGRPESFQRAANLDHHFFHHRASRIAARPDRPYRLVSEENLLRLLQMGNRCRLHLIGYEDSRLAGIADLLVLTDAKDRRKTALDGHAQFARHHNVCFTEETAAFGVADDHKLGAALAKHRRRDLPCQRS